MLRSRAKLARASNVASVILTDSMADLSEASVVAIADGCCGAAAPAMRSISSGETAGAARVLLRFFNGALLSSLRISY